METKNKFLASAIATTSISHVMEGREKLTTKELIQRYPNGFTVIEFDIYDPKKEGKKPYAIMAIQEDGGKFYFSAGLILTRVAINWASMYDGDIEAASEALKDSGGVKIKLEESRTKEGNSVTIPTFF